MDIILTEKSLRNFLKTSASTSEIIENLCNSGPTVDRFHQIGTDTLLEIEIITNRIDSASAFGVAREANAILNQNNINSELINNPYKKNVTDYSKISTKLNFAFEKENLVKRFTAISIDNVVVKPSPQNTLDLLTLVNQRPINNLVDITNEATLLYGIPSHVFDKDKLSLQNLMLRTAKSGEKITTLDNTTQNLQATDIIIEDGSGRIVDLCGVMGGQIAEVDEHTKNIVVIVPIYEPLQIRKTSLFHQKRTLAAQIYEKGPDPELCLPILQNIIDLVLSRAGGQVSSKIFDYYPHHFETKKVSLNLNWLNTFSGINIPQIDIQNILTNLGFTEVEIVKDILTCDVPTFRHQDINTREDLAEEITRVYGYNKILPTLPPLIQPPVPTASIFDLENRLRKTLASQDYNEIYNNSLISSELISKSNLKTEDHLKLKNSLSTDFEYLRTSLVPSLLQNHRNNKGKVLEPLKIFEIANIYLSYDGSELPNEQPTLCMTSSQKLLEIKKDFEKLFLLQNFSDVTFLQPSTNPKSYFNKLNTADIFIGKMFLGQIGEITTSTSRQFGLDYNLSVIEINLNQLTQIKPNLKYLPISEYPSLLQDITITTTDPISKIIDILKSSDAKIQKVKYKSTFENKKTFEITIGSYTQNLTQQDADQIRTKILTLFP